MKKLTKILLLTSLFFTFSCSTVFATNWTIEVNGNKLNTEIKEINDRTLVPLRAVGEALNLDVNYDSSTGIVTLETTDEHFSSASVWLDSKNNLYYAKVFSSTEGYQSYNLDVPKEEKHKMKVTPVEINDRLYVPVRIICDSFGAPVEAKITTISIGKCFSAEDAFSSNKISDLVTGKIKSPTITTNPAISTPPTNIPNNTSPADTTKWYPENDYRVGTDIPAGDYCAVQTTEKFYGYYCIYKDTSKTDIIDNDNFSNQAFFRVSTGQYLKLSGCKIAPASKVTLSNISTADGFYREGEYRVGIDIPAGEYQFTNTEQKYGGYYCVYSDMTKDDIVDNENFKNTTYYKVKNGQILNVNRAKFTLISNDSSSSNKNNNNNSNITSTNEIIGSWKLTNISRAPHKFIVDVSDDFFGSATFNANGTCSVNTDGTILTGTWKLGTNGYYELDFRVETWQAEVTNDGKLIIDVDNALRTIYQK